MRSSPPPLLALSRFRTLVHCRFTRAGVARADPSASPSRRGSPSRGANVCACTRADSESAVPTA